MITAIRRSFKSKIYKIILWITILALAGIFSLPELLKMGEKASWFAKVNAQTVSYNDYMRKSILHEERISALRSQFGPQADIFLSSMGISLNPKIFAQDAVIQDALLDQVVQKLKVHIGSDYIAEKLSNPLFVQQELAEIIPLSAFDQTGAIDPRVLQYYFQRMGLSMNDFEAKVAQILSRRLVLNILGLGIYAPASLVQNRYVLEHASKKFSLLTFSFDRMLQEEKKNVISGEDLKAFFDAQNQQSKRYFVPEKRSGVVWKLDVQNYPIELTDREIEDFYEDNKNKLYIAEPAQVQVRHILIKASTPGDQQKAYEKAQKIHAEIVKDPKQFAVIASKESEDKSQVERGGLLPWFKRGDKEAAFDKAAFTLKENGAISDVITTSQGFEIIQRVDKKMAVYKTLANVKKDISATLMQQKFGEQFVREMRGIIEHAKSDEHNLPKIMESKGFKAQKVQEIVRDDKNWGKVLFGMRTKNDTDVYIENGAGFVVQLTDIVPAYLPSLDTVKDVVTYDLHEKRAMQKMEKITKEALEKAKTTALNVLKDDFHASLATTPFIAKSDSQSLADLKKKQVPVDQLFQLENVGAVGMAFGGRDGYIFKLEEIKPLAQDSLEKQKSEVKSALEQEQSRLFTAGFVASLYRSATIEINQQTNEPVYPIAYED